MGTEPNLPRTSRSQPVTQESLVTSGGAGKWRRGRLLPSPGGVGEQARRRFMKARQSQGPVGR